MQSKSQRPRRRDILISNLSERADPLAIGAHKPNLWKPVPYTTDTFGGMMVGSGRGPKPVPITIRLDVKGWYRVWVGLYSYAHRGALQFRLSGDLCCREIRESALLRDWRHSYREATSLHETFWRDADLTGQSLVVESSNLGEDGRGQAALAFLRLEPIPAPKKARPRRFNHRLAITNDGDSIFGKRLHSRPEDLLEELDMIPRESPLRLLIWGIGNGDVCNYPTRVGNCFPTVGTFRNNRVMENLQQWRKKGWNSLALVRNYARRRGWEFQPYIRMESFDAPYPFDGLHSNFFHRHPEFHCFDSRGQRVMRLSYAYPEVQNHMLNLIRELAGYNPDGVCLAFIRGVPLVLYEPIMVDGFRKRHGPDPRELPETDPRWLAYQAEILTAFVRKAKSCLKPRQRLSAIVPGNPDDCRHWGLDAAAWVKEGLVDDLIVVGQKMNAMDVHEEDAGRLDFDWFSRLEGRKNIRLIPMLYTWILFNRDYSAWRHCFHSWLKRGADMYGVWDGTANQRFAKSDIGCAEGPEPTPPPEGATYKLLTLDGFRHDRYHHWEVI